MKKEELQKIQGVRMQAPMTPVRFTIDDEPFEFNPLPLATLLLIEEIKGRLNINETMLKTVPIAEYLIVTKRNTDDVRNIVCMLLSKGRFDLDTFKDIRNYLCKHCTVEDLCSLFIIGTIAQNLWLKETETDVPDFEGISEEYLWSKPFVELLKK